MPLLNVSAGEPYTVIMLDGSGSMGRFFMPLFQQFGARFSGMKNVKVIVFSDEAGFVDFDCRNPFPAGGTDIVQPFNLFHNLMQLEFAVPSRVDIVFVTDGVDSLRPTEAVGRLIISLVPLPCRSRLFTVGVCADFPTYLITDYLYPHYHQVDNENRITPPVIPVFDLDDVPNAVETLWEALTEPENSALLQQEIDEDMSCEDIQKRVKWEVSRVMFKVMERDGLPRVGPVDAAVMNAKLERDSLALRGLLVFLQQAFGVALAVERKMQPNAPQINAYLPTAFSNSARSKMLCSQVVSEHISRVKKLLKGLDEKKLPIMLPQTELGKLLCSTVVYTGKHSSTARIYRGADTEKMVKSFYSSVEAYVRKPEDEDKVCCIGYTSLADVMEDARKLGIANMPIGSVLDVIDYMNLPGVVYQVQRCPGVSMSSYLINVRGCDHKLPAVGAAALYSTLAKAKSERQDSPQWLHSDSTLLLCPLKNADGKIPEFMRHLASFMVNQDPTLYHHEAYPALVSAVFAWLLRDCDVNAEWVMQRLEQTVSMFLEFCPEEDFTHVYQYIRAMSTDECWKCFVIDHAAATKNPAYKYLKCPGLNKPFLALCCTALRQGEFGRMPAHILEMCFLSSAARLWCDVDLCSVQIWSGEGSVPSGSLTAERMRALLGEEIWGICVDPTCFLTCEEAVSECVRMLEERMKSGEMQLEPVSLNREEICAKSWGPWSINKLVKVFENLRGLMGYSASDVNLLLSDAHIFWIVKCRSKGMCGVQSWRNKPEAMHAWYQTQVRAATMGSIKKELKEKMVQMVESVYEDHFAMKHDFFACMPLFGLRAVKGGELRSLYKHFCMCPGCPHSLKFYDTELCMGEEVMNRKLSAHLRSGPFVQGVSRQVVRVLAGINSATLSGVHQLDLSIHADDMAVKYGLMEALQHAAIELLCLALDRDRIMAMPRGEEYFPLCFEWVTASPWAVVQDGVCVSRVKRVCGQPTVCVCGQPIECMEKEECVEAAGYVSAAYEKIMEKIDISLLGPAERLLDDLCAGHHLRGSDQSQVLLQVLHNTLTKEGGSDSSKKILDLLEESVPWYALQLKRLNLADELEVYEKVKMDIASWERRLKESVYEKKRAAHVKALQWHADRVGMTPRMWLRERIIGSLKLRGIPRLLTELEEKCLQILRDKEAGVA